MDESDSRIVDGGRREEIIPLDIELVDQYALLVQFRQLLLEERRQRTEALHVIYLNTQIRECVMSCHRQSVVERCPVNLLERLFFLLECWGPAAPELDEEVGDGARVCGAQDVYEEGEDGRREDAGEFDVTELSSRRERDEFENLGFWDVNTILDEGHTPNQAMLTDLVHAEGHLKKSKAQGGTTLDELRNRSDFLDLWGKLDLQGVDRRV